MTTKTWSAIQKIKVCPYSFHKKPKHQDRHCHQHRRDIHPPSKEAKYLGVIFDQDLKYRAHTNQAVKKGTQFGLVIGSIARATWGAPFQYLRRLFTAVAAPRMDSAAVIWHRPEDMRSPILQQQTKFSTVRRQIMKTMLGCFRTTATDALENETSLLPPRLRLREKVLKFVTRMLTAPPQYPGHQWIQRAHNPKMADANLPLEPRKHRQTLPQMHTRSRNHRPLYSSPMVVPKSLHPHPHR